MKEKLKAEQVMYRRHLAAERQFDNESQAILTAYRENLHQALAKTTTEIVDSIFRFLPAEDLAAAVKGSQTSLKALAQALPSQPEESVWRVNVFNLAHMGKYVSKHCAHIIECIKLDATEHPNKSISILLPNTTSASGKTTAQGPEFDEEVQQLWDSFKSALDKKDSGVKTRVAHVQFELELLKGSERPATVEILMVIPGGVSDNGKVYSSPWSRCFLWKKRRLQQDSVEPIHRREFKDWRRNNAACADQPKLSQEMERRMWQSGLPLHSAILSHIIKDMSFTSRDKILVRDFTMWDASLALSVRQQSEAGGAGPALMYCGMCWFQTKQFECAQVAREVHIAVEDSVMAHCRDEKSSHQQQAKRKLGQEPAMSNAARPVLQDELYVLTCPRANRELPLRQALYDTWGKITGIQESGMEWSDLVAAHDKEFNPSGVPWKTKRGPEVSLDALEVQTRPSIALPNQVLVSDIPDAKKLVGGRPCYAFHVQADGTLHIAAEEDSVIDVKETLFLIRGKFKDGEVAKDELRKNPQSIVYSLGRDSLVFVDFKTPPARTPPAMPVKLLDLLRFLEVDGQVNINLPYHKVTRIAFVIFYFSFSKL